ncbi:MAG: zinc metalloprotease HtpX [Candidatus Riflebacteria bacterium]|nr:zinc metalloprotease HtpX [Candidatus Riflebacteria bacterium]
MNMIKTTLLLGLLTGLLMFAGQMLGGSNGMLTALIIAAVMNFGSYWFSDSIVLAMYGAREIGPETAPDLHAIVRQLSERAGLPMPKVYVINSETPNAFATGRNPSHAAVAATTGILRMLSREELAGVMAHELAHVKNRDILISTIAATIAGALTYLAHMAQYAYMFGFGRRDNDDESDGMSSLVGNIVLIFVAPLAAMLIQMAISRSREYDADRDGASICGNPLFLANALRKLEMGNRSIPMRDANAATAHMFIVNPLTGGGLMSLFSTHPAMEERVRLLEEMARGR